MELNLMIIGGMIIGTVLVGGYIKLIEMMEEKMKRKTTKDIWYRV